MQKTSNYQLSQWDPEDRILREDFNSDNAKLDAALAAVDTKITAEAAARKAEVAAEAAARAEELAAFSGRKSLKLIKTVVLESDGRYVTLSFGTVDWSQWKAVYFDFSLYLQSSGYGDIDVSGTTVAQFNGGGVSTSGEPSAVNIRLLTYPLYSPGAAVCILPVGGGGRDIAPANCTFANFTSFSLRAVASDNLVLGGCTCKILGER